MSDYDDEHAVIPDGVMFRVDIYEDGRVVACGHKSDPAHLPETLRMIADAMDQSGLDKVVRFPRGTLN